MKYITEMRTFFNRVWMEIKTGRKVFADEEGIYHNRYTFEEELEVDSTSVDVVQVSDGIPKLVVNAIVLGNDHDIYIKNHPWQVIKCNIGWANDFPANKTLTVTADCTISTAPRLRFNSKGFLKRYELSINAPDDVIADLVGDNYDIIKNAIKQMKGTPRLHAVRAETLPAVRAMYFQVGKYNILTFGIEGRADIYLELLEDLFKRGK